MRQTAAKIFLSDHRKMQVSDLHRSFSTFSFGDNQYTHHEHFSNLYLLNDEEIAGGSKIKAGVKQASYILLLPVTGDLILEKQGGPAERIQIGELKIFSLPANSSFELTNPFAADIINYIQIMILANEQEYQNLESVYEFNLENNPDQLLTVSAPFFPFTASVGRFKGRTEGLYKMKNKNSHLFGFVVAGAFEFENRLLQMRDGLALSSIEEVEFEALSDGAILFTVELP